MSKRRFFPILGTLKTGGKMPLETLMSDPDSVQKALPHPPEGCCSWSRPGGVHPKPHQTQPALSRAGWPIFSADFGLQRKKPQELLRHGRWNCSVTSVLLFCAACVEDVADVTVNCEVREKNGSRWGDCKGPPRLLSISGKETGLVYFAEAPLAQSSTARWLPADAGSLAKAYGRMPLLLSPSRRWAPLTGIRCMSEEVTKLAAPPFLSRPLHIII